MIASKRGFIGRPMLAGIGQALPRPAQKRIFTPGLAEYRDPAGTKDAQKFSGGNLQVEMMKDGVAPDALEAVVSEGKPLAVGLKKIDIHLVGKCPALCLAKVAGGNVECRNLCTLTRQHDGCHAVTAAEVEQLPTLQVAKLVECRADPAFVIEILIVCKAQPARLAG